jgi:hypothetical protein
MQRTKYEEEDDMAGSGPGGWPSGADSWYVKVKERRDKFIADHPEWTIVYVRSMDRYEASKGDTDSALVILHDKSLGTLMDRLEAEFGFPAEDQDRVGRPGTGEQET